MVTNTPKRKKIGRNDPCFCSSGLKYKKCCLEKDEEKSKLRDRVMKITRKDFISGPYKKCPNNKCLAEEGFGVFTPMSESKTYMRECIKCGYQENFKLPNIQKKIVYLDQFVISNLVKLLDKSHPSHQKIIREPFWKSLFIKLERASKSQAMICPDSFYHRDESLTGKIDFRLMERLYEHFSDGKTLHPSIVIERDQIIRHFEDWLDNRKMSLEFLPEDISFGKNLHSWALGIRVSVSAKPYPGELEKLHEVNTQTKKNLEAIWSRWQTEKNVKFVDRIQEEALGLGRGLIEVSQSFLRRRLEVERKIALNQDYEMDLSDFLPPISNDIFEGLARIAQSKGLQQEQVAQSILKYFNDVEALLEIPQIRITATMFAGLAHRAANGKKEPPKSTTDVQFISSYLPYCDALFVDKESASLLQEFPKNTPAKFRLDQFNAKIFSLRNKEAFLDYLDRLVEDLPEAQINILKDIGGDDYADPYWSIIESEKARKKS